MFQTSNISWILSLKIVKKFLPQLPSETFRILFCIILSDRKSITPALQWSWARSRITLAWSLKSHHHSSWVLHNKFRVRSVSVFHRQQRSHSDPAFPQADAVDASSSPTSRELSLAPHFLYILFSTSVSELVERTWVVLVSEFISAAMCWGAME